MEGRPLPGCLVLGFISSVDKKGPKAKTVYFNETPL